MTGSLEGMLRVFSPKMGEYGASHLTLEIDLEDPILQLSFGRFVP